MTFVPVVRIFILKSINRVFAVSKLSGLRYFHMCWMAKPVADRLVYKTIKKRKIKSIVEFGLGDGDRCEKLIQVCQKFAEGQPVKYTGIDLFESRDESQPAISLLEMHKRLNKTGAKVKLVPGDEESATARVANSLAGTDLILLSTNQSLDDLERFWFFLPRMVHAESLLFVAGTEKFRVLRKSDWSRWTERNRVSKAA